MNIWYIVYGKGQGLGQGRGLGRGPGVGRGRGYGGPKNCKCPKCGSIIPHARGIPCMQQKCPKCGTNMIPAQ